MISRETIEQIRNQVEIVSVIGERVKLKRRGRSYVGLCPFHNEKTPSFHVNPEHGRFYCFGCHEKGSVIDFVMKFEGLTFVEAVRTLAEQAGIPIVEDGHSDGRHEAHQRQLRHHLFEVMDLAAGFFEQQLREHPHANVAKEELTKRGLSSQMPTAAVTDTLQAFRMGYAPGGWDSLVNFLHQHQISPAIAESLGLIVARKGGNGFYDFFRNRLMFAIIDPQGRVIGFSGRILPDPETGEVDKHTGKYINSPESPIYNKSSVVFGLYQARRAIKDAGVAILVEGNFDVVALHARGLHNVVAPLGTAFTPSQARLISRFARKVVLLFDGDQAGKKATKAAREPCQEAGLDAYVAVLPDGVDPDDLVREHGPEAVGNLIDHAQGMLSYLIRDVLEEGFPRDDMQQQARKVRRVAELLASERDPTVRALARHYADTIAAKLDIADVTTFRALERQVNAALRRASAGEPEVAPTSSFRTDQNRLPLEMFGAAIDFPSILDTPEVIEAMESLDGDVVLGLHALRQIDTSQKQDWEQTFLAHLPSTIHEFAASRLAAPLAKDATEARSLFLSNAQKWKRLVLSREHAQVIQDINLAGTQGDTRHEDELLLEAVRKQKKRLGL